MTPGASSHDPDATPSNDPDDRPPHHARPAHHARPEHHAPGGGFRNPWPPHPDAERRAGGFFRWGLDRLRADLPPDPDPSAIPTGEPEPARSRTDSGELRITWIGHASFLLQVGGINLLTDPVFSRRVSPVRWGGPARFTPPGLGVDDLPPVDAVLLSHDHFDHLDRPSVEALRERFGPGLPWITPLGYRDWLGRRGLEVVRELDWWDETPLVPADGHALRIVCLPARHWTRRSLRKNRRLWASWATLPGDHPDSLSAPDSAPRGLYYGGDSGWCPAFAEIGGELGPFRASLLPIGAYEPRWFMAGAHMNPEDAVRAYRALGGEGAFVGMHWGTFRLTDEDPLEPPERTRRAWREADLPMDDLHLPGIGETVTLPPARDP